LSVFTSPPPTLPPAPKVPTKEETAAEAEAARREEVIRQNKRRGRGADTLTGGGGVTDKANTARVQVLGA